MPKANAIADDLGITNPAVKSDMKHWPIKVVQGEDGRPKIQVEVKGDAKTFFPEESSSAMVLVKMKETAEAFLGQPAKDAVITVLAYFDDSQPPRGVPQIDANDVSAQGKSTGVLETYKFLVQLRPSFTMAANPSSSSTEDGRSPSPSNTSSSAKIPAHPQSKFQLDLRSFSHLNLLLHFDAQQFLDVISTCADEPVFAQSEGRLKRLVDVLVSNCIENANNEEHSPNELGPLLVTFVSGLLQKGAIPENIFLSTRLIESVLQRPFPNLRSQMAEQGILELFRICGHIERTFEHLFNEGIVKQENINFDRNQIGSVELAKRMERRIEIMPGLTGTHPIETRQGNWMPKLFRHFLNAIGQMKGKNGSEVLDVQFLRANSQLSRFFTAMVEQQQLEDDQNALPMVSLISELFSHSLLRNVPLQSFQNILRQMLLCSEIWALFDWTGWELAERWQKLAWKTGHFASSTSSNHNHQILPAQNQSAPSSSSSAASSSVTPFPLQSRQQICVKPKPIPSELIFEIFASLILEIAFELLRRMPNGILARNIRQMIKRINLQLKNNKWNEVECGQKLAISEGGLVVKHLGPNGFNSIRAILPVPSFKLSGKKPTIACYFEVAIDSETPELHDLGIGFCTQQFPLERKWLGTMKNSIGTNAKVGMWINGEFKRFKNSHGRSNAEDVIGVGLIHSTGNSSMKCFTTWNGQLLGIIELPTDFATLKLFPAATFFYAGESIRTNFGRSKWRFDPNIQKIEGK